MLLTTTLQSYLLFRNHLILVSSGCKGFVEKFVIIYFLRQICDVFIVKDNLNYGYYFSMDFLVYFIVFLFQILRVSLCTLLKNSKVPTF